MNQSKSIKIIAGAFILALLVFIGFKYLNTSNSVSNSDSANALETVKQDQTVVGKDIIAELMLLNSINLDDSIFKSDVYRSLSDFTLKVVPEPQGRDNPFAPFGSNSVTRATSTGSSR